jgi:hypothetical protein
MRLWLSRTRWIEEGSPYRDARRGIRGVVVDSGMRRWSNVKASVCMLMLVVIARDSDVNNQNLPAPRWVRGGDGNKRERSKGDACTQTLVIRFPTARYSNWAREITTSQCPRELEEDFGCAVGARCSFVAEKGTAAIRRS